MFDLTGLNALVTGATGGLGGAMARALHKQGATVAISGTRKEALEALAGELGTRVHVRPCNLSDKDEVEALVPAAETALGQLDILVNNAGITRDGLFMRMKDEDWDQVLAVNLTSAFRLPCSSQGYDEAPLWPHHWHHLSRRRDGQSRSGQLCGFQGWHDRDVEIPRRRGRDP